MPFPNEHAARLHAPSRYNRFRRQNDKFGVGIDAIWGRRKSDGKWELQAIRFDSAKFTVAQARKWLKDHDHKAILFEPASKAKSLVTEYEGFVVDMLDANGKVVETLDFTSGLARGDETMGMEAVLTEEFATDPGKKTFSKNARYNRVIPGAQAYLSCKAEQPSTPNGGVGGYASVWDVIDHQGEVVRKGAFTKSISERGESGKIPLMVRHYCYGGDVVDAVGVVNDLVEDNYGLKFDASYFKDEHSQKIRVKVKEILDGKIALGSSVGYRVINYSIIRTEDGKTVVELKELAIGEITITLKPANTKAAITHAKDANDITDLAPMLQPLHDAKIVDMTVKDKAALLETYGGRAKVVSLGNALKGIADTLGLLAVEPQATADADGAPKPGTSSAGPGKDTSGKGATTSDADVANSRARAVELARLAVRQIQAETV